MDLQVELLVHLDSRLKCFERFGVHLVLLVGNSKLVPREDVLCSQLLFKCAILAILLILVQRVLEDVGALIDLIGGLAYQL